MAGYDASDSELSKRGFMSPALAKDVYTAEIIV